MLSNIQLKNYFSDGFILVDKLLSEEEVDKFLVSQEQNKKKITGQNEKQRDKALSSGSSEERRRQCGKERDGTRTTGTNRE